jgi:hypothetical protein
MQMEPVCGFSAVSVVSAASLGSTPRDDTEFPDERKFGRVPPGPTDRLLVHAAP